jgi:hypothetical protein
MSEETGKNGDLFEDIERLLKRLRFVGLAAPALLLLGFGIAWFTASRFESAFMAGPGMTVSAVDTSQVNASLRSARQQTERLAASYDGLLAFLDSMGRDPDRVQPNAELSEVTTALAMFEARSRVMEARLVSVSERMEVLEQSIMQNPERALALPMLRSEVAQIQSELSANATSLREDVAGVGQLAMWSLAIAIALAVGMAALLVQISLALPKLHRDKAGEP